MKSVLISIQPKWCKLISNGKKTIEVRKTKPKLKPPFKCYIYCTKPREKIFYHGEYYNDLLYKDFWSDELICGCTMGDALNGKVIGEFVCDTIVIDKTFGHDPLFNGAACMSEVETAAYSCQSPIYGWHISDLKIYDMPKELSNFTGLRETKFGAEPIKITRPPQSWCYVEEVE